MDSLLADVSIQNAFIGFWAERIISSHNRIPMNSENLKVIRLVNRRDDYSRTFPKTKELMADHFDVKVFMIK